MLYNIIETMGRRGPTGDFSMQCNTCRFFQTDKTQCRRYAPQPTADAKNAHWPVVAVNDWCGEYQPSEKAAATA
jgi:hypothetical protein